MRRIAVVIVLLVVGCAPGGSDPEGAARADDASGSPFISVGVRSEPLTWNRLLATDRTSHLISERLHATLVRVNRVTQELEPELAESWGFSDDGEVLTFRLRPGVRFSDGVPFSAQDVAFTFRAIHDPRTGSPLKETASLSGKPLVPEVVDPLTVRFRLPFRSAGVLRLFDSLYILPRHRLERSLAGGDFASAYGVGAMPENIVGLGAFALHRYLPGQRVVLRRNPHYWKSSPCGERLPHLEGLFFEILGGSSTAVLRLLSGELDIVDRVSTEDFLALMRRAPPHLRLLDLGPGLASEWLWFNLSSSEKGGEDESRVWFRDVKFRRAVSLAIDRDAIVRGVYHGLATPSPGPISPGNRPWFNEALAAPVLDRSRARQLLAEASFTRDRAGVLRDPRGKQVKVAVITDAENPHRSRVAAILEQDLAELGIELRIASLDTAALIARISRTHDYQAALFGISWSDPDPSTTLPLWLSRSPLHVWHPRQPEPATDWEAHIDTLMDAQARALDPASRKAIFDEVQDIAARELPVVNLVNPHVLVAVSRRLRNLQPTAFWHSTLWSAEDISVRVGTCQ